MNHSEQHYYSARVLPNGQYQGRVYHYDETGNRQIVVHATELYDTEGETLDTACGWAEDHSIDVELG